MRDKKQFAFLIRPNERQALKRLADTYDLSEGATLRLLIRAADRQLSEISPVKINLPDRVNI